MHLKFARNIFYRFQTLCRYHQVNYQIYVQVVLVPKITKCLNCKDPRMCDIEIESIFRYYFYKNHSTLQK